MLAIRMLSLAGGVALVASCARAPAEGSVAAGGDAPRGAEYVVKDTVVSSILEAMGVAEPIAEATVSTKLMGAVTAVLVREGDRVRAGQPLIRIDARDLEAKRAQVEAGLAEAEAVYRDALTQAERFRNLYAEEAATRAQLDAAETGLARAEAALERARGAAAELQAIQEYSVIRAPFEGVVTKRFVDPGAFAAPGAPLITIQDGSRLRVKVSAAPGTLGTVRPGQTVEVRIEGVPASGVVEGVVPAPGGNLYVINAVVENRDGRFVPNGSARLFLVQGERRAILVPAAAIHRDGDLAGVYVRGEQGTHLRWVRLAGDGAGDPAFVEVLSGLRPGERLVIPTTPANGRG